MIPPEEMKIYSQALMKHIMNRDFVAWQIVQAYRKTYPELG